MRTLNLLIVICIVVFAVASINDRSASQNDFAHLYSDNNYIDGELIVKFKGGVDAGSFVGNRDDIGLSIKEVLIPDMNLYLLEYDPGRADHVDALLSVMRSDKVEVAQFNHTFKERVLPNDTRFAEQWDKNNTGQSGGTIDADIDAVEAWDKTTGGLTVNGDTIVVAVVDGGQQIAHPDLNTWRNWGEIPGNGIDDDANGYIDDVNGWNAGSNNGTIPANSHGTHCAGIVGARGNNSLGVAGVNWGIKVMPIVYGSATEANALKAYGYAFKQRKKYNETNGTQGAFIVSTNSSWGIDFGNPANYPLWCAFYDTLGSVGILSAGAGPNLNINIDTQGDVPTTCPSNYLIAVTNTTRTDARNSSAGYGPINMDLGAPGTSILSTIPTNNYGNSTGTSMATPQVAGAVALLHAGVGSTYMNLVKNDPDSAALLFKKIILSSVDTITSMSTVLSKGRLNVNKMLNNVATPKLELTYGIQSMWDGAVQVSDTIRVYARSSSAPYNVVDSAIIMLNTSGTAIMEFANLTTGNYYIQTKHRNAIVSWSSLPVSLTAGSTTTYNFTDLQTKTFGNNSTLVSGRYCSYSGNPDGDNQINLSDVILTYNDASVFATGYVNADANGDNIVNLNDLLITMNNSSAFVAVVTP